MSLLSAIIVLFYIGMYKNEYFDNIVENISNQQSKCDFKPSGKSINACVTGCIKSNNLCYKTTCNNICKECNDTDCQWIVDSLKPHQPQIYVKPLVNSLEVSWKRPKTEYRIIKYTIVLQKTSDSEHKSFYFPIGKGTPEIKYQIVDLDPEDTYIVHALATNRFGNSPISNKVIISPLKKGNTPEDVPIHKLAYHRGEYIADDLKEVLEKVIESKQMEKPYRVTARY